MPNIQKIPIDGAKGWRWKIKVDDELPFIKGELQRSAWGLWLTMAEFQFNLHMIKRRPTIGQRCEEWYRPDFHLESRLNSKWKDYCRTHKIN